MTNTITVIGGGNMGGAIVGGLLATGYDSDKIEIVEPDPKRAADVAKQFKVTLLERATDINLQADMLLLAVKPQILAEVVKQLRQVFENHPLPLIVSIAAGITTDQIAKWFERDTRIVRAMPNTPCLVGAGAAGLFATNNVDAKARQSAEHILSAVGLALWVEDEPLLDAVTALSGSGPAYFFLVLEALEQAAVELGLSESIARQLAQQTALGSAQLAQQSEYPPGELRRQVTSPGGTTERALAVLSEQGVVEAFNAALHAADRRAKELAAES